MNDLLLPGVQPSCAVRAVMSPRGRQPSPDRLTTVSALPANTGGL